MSITLLSGDCRDVIVPFEGWMRYDVGMKHIRDVAVCKSCRWSWKPTTGLISEPCPRCGKMKSVRVRTDARDNLAGLQAWRAKGAPQTAQASVMRFRFIPAV